MEMSSAIFMSRSQQGLELGEALEGTHVLPQPFVQLAGHQAAVRGRIKQRCERRLLAWGDAFHQAWRDHSDACISVARSAVAFDFIGDQPEVAARAMRRV